MVDVRPGALRYCQTVLKIMPALMAEAEQAFIDKTELVFGLPGTAGALKALVQKQQEGVSNLLRHLQFFIKWSAKFYLPLPKQLQESLVLSQDLLKKYSVLLKNEFEDLPCGIVVFDAHWKKEQDICARLLHLLAEPVSKAVAPEKRAYADLYNQTLFYARGFISPIAKVLQIILLAIVFFLPSIAYAKEPVLKPVQAAQIAAPMIRDPDKLAQKLAKDGWTVVQIAKARSDGRPTIIIKGDVHGSPEKELKFARYMQSSHGINFIAIEGWAGFDADQQRGYTLLNAEESFIKKVLFDSAFHKIALEDAVLQEEGLKVLVLKGHTSLQYLQQELPRRERLLALWTKDIEQLKAEKEAEKDEAKKDAIKCRIELKESAVKNIKEVITEIKRQIAGWSAMVDYVLKKLETTIPELEKEYKEMLDQDFESFIAACDEVLVDKRSKLWAQVVAGVLAGKNSILVVMGEGHVQSFTDNLKQLGDFNIIVVAP